MDAKTRKVTRKTPCESCKGQIRRSTETGSTYIHCNGCGEWSVKDGKASRPIGWRGNVSVIGYR